MWLKLLLNQAVRQVAEDKVRRWIDDAVAGPGEAKDGAADQGAESSRAARGPQAEELVADRLLIFGSQAEAGGWLDGATIAFDWPVEAGRLFRGSVAEREFVAWVASSDKADPVFGERLIELVRPRVAIVAGFGVGLDEGTPQGTIVIADRVRDEGGGVIRSAIGLEQAEDDPRRGIRYGLITTVSRPPAPGPERKSLHADSGAVLAEPDGAGHVALLDRAGIPWLAVRIATEGVEDAPSLQLRALLDQATLSGKIGAAVGSLWQEPKSAKELWRIQEDALRAGDRLGKSLRWLVGSLPT